MALTSRLTESVTFVTKCRKTSAIYPYRGQRLPNSATPANKRAIFPRFLQRGFSPCWVITIVSYQLTPLYRFALVAEGLPSPVMLLCANGESNRQHVDEFATSYVHIPRLSTHQLIGSRRYPDTLSLPGSTHYFLAGHPGFEPGKTINHAVRHFCPLSAKGRTLLNLAKT